MIIRNHDTELIMIEQDHHAHLSEEMIHHWINHFFKNDPFVDSVMYAIRTHDCGWRPFDKQPFWNDQTDMPYDFTSFPVIPKTVLYTQGIDEVEAVDPYAAALCSAHYMKFVSKSNMKEAKDFLKEEEKRVHKILASYPQIDSEVFDKHVKILQFADNISLYICLNDPGVSQENVHPFFKQGIAISTNIDGIAKESIGAHWKDEDTIILKGLPYVKPFTISIQQKNVSKQAIHEQGILKTYEQTPYENVDIQLMVE